MGGAAGHLQHLYEDRDLTFKDLKKILSDASQGNLEEATEKFDGMNIMFSWEYSTNALRVARSDGDIKRGGMNAKQLSEKFKGRGQLSEAFNNAYKVLRGTLSTLSQHDKKSIFGTNKNRWYSVEVIYAENPNVINYDCNALTFHSWPVKSLNSNRVVVVEAPEAADTLIKNVDKMQKSLVQSTWKVSGPFILKLKRLSDGTSLKEAVNTVNAAMMRAGVSDRNTLGDYLRSLLEESVLDLMLTPKVSEMVVSRCMEDSFAPSLIDIKKLVEKNEYVAIRQFVENCPSLFREYLQPIKHAINVLATEMLEGLKSSLISNGEQEISRIRQTVSSKISEITALGDKKTSHLLEEHLRSLGSIDRIVTPVEGVVFVYKGRTYKFTGSFSAVNQILGLTRY